MRMRDIGEATELVKGMKLYAAREQSWAQARGKVISQSLYGHGGASVGMTWPGEEACMVAFLMGERSPYCDPKPRNRYAATCRELGLKVRPTDPNSPDELFPFLAHAIDPDVSVWSGERFFATFRPTGELYALQDRKYKLDMLAENFPDLSAEQFLNLALTAIRVNWHGEQQARRRYLEEKNAMRRERNLPEYTCFAHAHEPTRWEAQHKRKAS